ncbi:hypothetical protein BN1723_020893, partial [Verticillium longisporum]
GQGLVQVRPQLHTACH